MLVQSTQLGQTWRWGFADSDAPNVGNGFFPNEGEVTYAPEVASESKNGEGHTDSMTVSKPEFREWTASFKGRIDDSFDATAFPVSFSWQGRTFVILRISHPMMKGEYHEVTLETRSPALL